MTQQVTFDAPVKKKSLPIAGQAMDIDAELKKFEDEERARLGIAVEQQWVEDMANLIGRVPCHGLEVGSDVSAIPEVIGDFLAGLSSG